MKKNIGFLIILASALSTGCSNLALKKEWQERGYTDSDIAKIEPFKNSYSNMLGSGSSGAFGSHVEDNENHKRVRTIFCACVKKLGKKCQQKPSDLSGDDLDLWAKANGAEMALRQTSAIRHLGSFDSSAGSIDTAECM